MMFIAPIILAIVLLLAIPGVAEALVWVLAHVAVIAGGMAAFVLAVRAAMIHGPTAAAALRQRRTPTVEPVPTYHADGPRGRLRIGDGDRDRLHRALATAMRRGYLDAEEYGRRDAQVAQAVRHAEVADVLDDLPEEALR